MTATFFFLVPMMCLSGFIFPIENMPRVIQAITVVIPLRYFLVIVRGIFLKGVGWDVLWPQFAALATWGVTILPAPGRARGRTRSSCGNLEPLMGAHGRQIVFMLGTDGLEEPLDVNEPYGPVQRVTRG